jgi:hypothetical protein
MFGKKNLLEEKNIHLIFTKSLILLSGNICEGEGRPDKSAALNCSASPADAPSRQRYVFSFERKGLECFGRGQANHQLSISRGRRLELYLAHFTR